MLCEFANTQPNLNPWSTGAGKLHAVVSADMVIDQALEAEAAQFTTLERPCHKWVEPMSEQDVPAAAEMAVRLLPASGFVAGSARPFILAALYRAALDHPSTIALKVVDAGARPVGFCLVSTDVDGFEQFVRPRILVATVRALLGPARMRLIPHLWRSLAESKPRPHVPAELLLLYVDETCQRSGSGRKLVLHVEAELAGRGACAYRVAVRSQLASARAFYTAMGFLLEQERPVLGQPMTYFMRKF